MTTSTPERLKRDLVTVRFPVAWKRAMKQRADSRGSDFSTYIREAALRFMEQEGITL